MLDKKSRILGIIVLVLGFLILFSKQSQAQNVIRNGKTFVQQVDSSKKTVKEPQKTEYTYMDHQGQVYPIYLSSTGKAFIVRTSKRTGKEYRQYLPEVTKALNTNKAKK